MEKPPEKQLGVLILDKADWLAPENGPGEASFSYNEGSGCVAGLISCHVIWRFNGCGSSDGGRGYGGGFGYE